MSIEISTEQEKALQQWYFAGLNPDNDEFAMSKIEAGQNEFNTVCQIAEDVIEDENSRLPYIPKFYRTLQPEVEEKLLEEKIPRVQQALGEQFCLSACEKEGKDCMSVCKEFSSKAFGVGNWLFYSLHKPYIYTDLVVSEEQ